jgi:hypothetical protein
MRKLKLDVSSLRVESFAAHEGHGPRAGTVRAKAGPSDAESCNVTECFDTCWCPNTSPRPSCNDCSWDACATADPAVCD